MPSRLRYPVVCPVALREQEYVELCHQCKHPAAGPCLCCGLMLCAEHGPPADDQRCPTCEAEYVRKNARMIAAANGKLYSSIGRFTVGFICVLFAPSLAGMALATQTPLGFAGAIATVVGAIAWYRHTPPRKLTAEHIMNKRRARFLRKRARGLPPAGDADAD